MIRFGARFHIGIVKSMLSEDEIPTWPEFRLRRDDVHERPTLPDPLAPPTPSYAFFVDGEALEETHRRQQRLFRWVASITALGCALAIAAAWIEWRG